MSAFLLAFLRETSHKANTSAVQSATCRHGTRDILKSNLDYPDSLRPHEIVRIIEGPDNRKDEY